MKSISLTLILVALFAAMLKAQPVLTKANTQIIKHEAWNVRVTHDSGVSPGSAGANQTWDFSGLTVTSPKLVEVVWSGESPSYAGSYIKAHRAFRATEGATTVYTYLDTSGNSLQMVGIRDWKKPPSFCLADYWEWMRYPLQYSDRFSDSFSNVYGPYCDGVASITGNSTLMYDGYGTLTTPTGSFDSVVRLKLNATYIIGDNLPPHPNDTFTIEDYRWYQPGIHYPVARISTVRKNSFAPEATTEFFSSFTTVGIDEETGPASGFSVSPVPANDRLHLSFNSKRVNEMHITITDIAGRVLIAQTATSAPSKTSFDVNIAHLPPGNYVVKLTTSEQCETRKFVKY